MATTLACAPFTTVDAVRADASCAACFDATITDADILAWVEQSSDLIAIVSGMRVPGECTLVARPCRDGVRCWCDCCHLDAIPLGDPKPTIEDVFIDGVALDPDEYDLHWGLNGWSLVRLGDGTVKPPPWPSYQERWKADTEDGTFAIYFTTGVPVDQIVVQNAVLELVCDYATDAVANQDNKLQPGVVQAQLGGTTVTVDEDRLNRIRAGETGPALTQLMALYAPTGRFQSAVYAPELAEGWNLNLRIPAPVGS